MSEELHVLRAAFDQEAWLYDQARPGYPPSLLEDVIALTCLPSTGSILEIGCGTGQATLPFAERGYRILAIELGANLAAMARHKLASFPQAQVWIGAFEDWPVQQATFDLCIFATAFHWIDPAISYPKVARALRPGGSIALFWNKHVQAADTQGFFEASQEVYRREAPEIFVDESLPRAEEVEEPVAAQMEATGLFGPVTVRRYVWVQEYDADSYLRLLNTYSGHLALPPSVRAHLFEGIRDLINTRFNGQIRKGYLSLLYVAQAIATQ
ncbi:MAG TPA: class I SAM-dependent methyltransferase [Chthonomonadaceae bacterium]|nr:class I SAM-dependent methyltransferase [Chthonomonadaceae bacterium]